MVAGLLERQSPSADRVLLPHPVVLHEVVQAVARAVDVCAGHRQLFLRMQPGVELLLLQRRLLALALHVLRGHGVVPNPADTGHIGRRRTRERGTGCVVAVGWDAVPGRVRDAQM